MKAWIKARLAPGFVHPKLRRRLARKTVRETLALAESEITVGDSFGMLITKLKTDPKNWQCVCECGIEEMVPAQKLVLGRRDRCKACLDKQRIVRGERSYERGYAFDSYSGAKGRCTNPKDAAWCDYGGRGIKFKFSSFDEFFDHLGPRPFRKSIDRIDNDGHYEPGNVRWATQTEQARNTRRTKLKVKDAIFIRKACAAGIRMAVLASWFGVSRATIHAIAINRSWVDTSV